MDVREKTSNEKRLIDANALMSYMDECSKESRFRVYYGYAKSFINAAPTIDAVPVVRCEKCVAHGSCFAERVFVCAGIENPYCCAGERKEGDE